MFSPKKLSKYLFIFLSLVIATSFTPLIANAETANTSGNQTTKAWCYSVYTTGLLGRYAFDTLQYTACRNTSEECSTARKNDPNSGTGDTLLSYAPGLANWGGAYATACKETAGATPGETHSDDLPPAQDECSFIPMHLTACLRLAAAKVVQVWIFLLLLFLRFVGILFSYALHYSIVQFSTFANSAGIIAFWKVGRDLANIAFIFILLYLALKIVLDFGGGQAKAMIPKVLLIALVLNFSMVLPKVVIDVSNVIALGFYEKMGIDLKRPDGRRDVATPFLRNALSGSKAKAIIGNNTITANQDTDINNDGDSALPTLDESRITWSDIISQLIFGTILVGIACWVFLVAGVLFIIRSVVLLFILALSSIAVFFYLFPSQGVFKRWQNTLFKEAFFAPAFMFLLYGVFQVASTDSFSNAANGGSFVAQIFTYCLTISMLIGSLLLAREMGTKGAGISSKGASRAKAMFAAGTIGLGAGLAANTIGRLANRTNEGEFGSGLRGKAARFLTRSNSMDEWASKSRIGSGVRSSLNAVAGSGFFTGRKGFNQREKARQDAEKKFYGDFKTDEQKANYFNRVGNIRSLGGRLPGGNTSKKDLYGNLNAEDRAKLENTIAPYSTMGDERKVVQALRNNLDDKARTETTVAMMKDMSSEEKMATLTKIAQNAAEGGQKTANDIFAQLDAKTQRDIVASSLKSGDAGVKKLIDDMRDALKEDKKQALTDFAKEQSKKDFAGKDIAEKVRQLSILNDEEKKILFEGLDAEMQADIKSYSDALGDTDKDKKESVDSLYSSLNASRKEKVDDFIKKAADRTARTERNEDLKTMLDGGGDMAKMPEIIGKMNGKDFTDMSKNDREQFDKIVEGGHLVHMDPAALGSALKNLNMDQIQEVHRQMKENYERLENEIKAKGVPSKEDLYALAKTKRMYQTMNKNVLVLNKTNSKDMPK